MKTVILSGLGDAQVDKTVLCCALPVHGLGDLFTAVNNVAIQANKGLPIAPAKAVLNNIITKTNEKITGVTKVLPMVTPAVIKPAANAQIVKDVANAAVKIVTPNTGLKPAIVPSVLPLINTAVAPALAVKDSDCKTCFAPVRSVPQPVVKVSPQTGGNTAKKIQIREYNAAEKNAMTRVVIEPIRKMLEANLNVVNNNPTSLVALYNVPVYKSFLTETLSNWDNPAALKDVFSKYKGKVTNTQAMQARAMQASLKGLGENYVDIMHRFPIVNFNNMNSYGVASLGSLGDWDWSDPVGSIGNSVSNAAKWVGDKAGDAWDAVKGAANKTADFLGDVGRAVGDGLKNAATWVVGMIQKYNPIMILGRSAFRGLLAINFRGWASDMQGMRDRGEENKIKDVWTGTLVGGNWGDLVSSINEGAGRDKKTDTNTQAQGAVETVDAPPPYPTPLDIRLLKQMTQPAIDSAVRKYNNDIAEYNKNYNPQPNLKPLPTDIKAIVTSGKLLEIRGQENGNATGLFTDYASIGNLFSAGDYVQVAVSSGDIRYNGTYKVKYLGDDAKGNTWSTITVDLPIFKNAQGKTSQAAGTITKVAKPVAATAPTQMTSNAWNSLFAQNGFSQFATAKPVNGLGEPVTAASLLVAATPVIGLVTAVITGGKAAKTGDPKTDALVDTYNNAKTTYDNGKAIVEQGKGYVDTANQYIDKGKAIVDQGNQYIDKGKEIINPYIPKDKDSNQQNQNNGNNNANGGAVKLLSGNILEMRGQEAGNATGLFTDYAGVGSIIQAGDLIQIAVKTGDTRYNGKFKVKYIGDDAGQNTWSTITIDLPRLVDSQGKTAQATGVFTAILNANQGGNGGNGSNIGLYLGLAAALALGVFLYASSRGGNAKKSDTSGIAGLPAKRIGNIVVSKDGKRGKPKTIKNFTI